MELKRAIQQEAQRLGFVLVGVTTPDPPSHIEVFERWLEAGRQGKMDYLAKVSSREKRADPRKILPECKSILVLAAPYYPAQQQPPKRGSGRVAAYAWGDDYHEVLVERLQRLAEHITSACGEPLISRWYTDTGPLLERDLAARAGLGWIGKNTCLINPGLGSYIFLAEILLGIELEPDKPFPADRCGSCRRCLDACPTNCILPNRTLDAGRCISYLSIELKEHIPIDLRPQMGSWVFGCDICQQVCPWNRFAKTEGDPAFAPCGELPSPDLMAELGLTREGFNQKFKHSAVRRSKRHGYLRNVAVAMGNNPQPEYVNALSTVVECDAEPLVRAHAAWALGRIGSAESRRALEIALQDEHDPQVLAEIREALKIGL